MKKKSGFTLVEAIVTLAILTVSTGLVVLVLNSLIRVQGASQDEERANSDLHLLDNTVSKYVSLVSQKTEVRNFTFKSCDPDSLVFSYGSYDYRLSYSNPNLAISTNYDGSESDLIVSETSNLSSISNVVFSYDVNLDLLIVNATSRGVDNKYTYVVRV